MKSRHVLAAAGAVTLTLGLAGCDAGGGEEYKDAQELWSAVGTVASCSDQPEFETRSGHSTLTCYSIPLEDGTTAEIYGLVASDAEQLTAAANDLDLPMMLTGPNWTIFIEADEDGAEPAVSAWLDKAQTEIGGEVGNVQQG